MTKAHPLNPAEANLRHPSFRNRFADDSRQILAEDGVSFMMYHPLARSVVDALKLKWAAANWYEAWISAVEVAGKSDMTRSRKLLEAALSSPECDPHVNYTYGLVLAGLGDHTGAHQAFGRAHRAYPLNAEYARKWVSGLVPHAQTEPDPLAAGILSRYPG